MPNPLGDFSYTWPYYAAAVIGYLLGSIPFGLVVTKLVGFGDIRSTGSGNIGTTNVLRTGRKDLAALTLLLDGGKGAAAAWFGSHFYGPDIGVLAGGGAFLGHLFPVWLKFKGGKGFATFLGILLAVAWPLGIAACLTWLFTAVLARYSSFSTLNAATHAPILALFFADQQVATLAGFMTVLIFLRHYANIRRLLKGEEPAIGKS
jgi:glycerol-3-phosphate acyltransferase PlsY